jgi:RNA polymerase sigma-70 factor (sigma-E family)
MTVSTPPSAADAIDDLYRAHALGLVRFALMLVGDQGTAEDVVQEAFLGLYRGWHRVRDQASVLAYLRAAVVNRARGVQRSRRRGRLRMLQHAQPDPPVWSAEAAAIDGEDRRLLLAAVAALPPRQREVLALKYFLDLSEADVAAILGITRGTVSSTGTRAIAALAKQLKEAL